MFLMVAGLVSPSMTTPIAAPPLLCVTTASSLEGAAFCRHALRTPNEFRVRALVRNPSSLRARQLEELGAEIVVADNHDVDALSKAFDGASGVYACTTWSGSRFTADGTVVRPDDLDPRRLEESEVEQGLNILRAAEHTPSLRHFVLQSMHRAGREAPDASVDAPLHHRAKWRQEEALRASRSLGCAWSILRQPTYLENFANDETAAQGTQLRLLRPGVVSGLLAPKDELSVISVDDLGAIAVAMLRAGPEAYDQRVLAAATDRVSGELLAAAATRVHGACSFEYRQVPWFVLRFLIPVDYPYQLQRWLTLGGNDEGARADAAAALAECRKLHPEMQSIDEWLHAKGVAALPLPPVQRVQRALDAIRQEAPTPVVADVVQSGAPPRTGRPTSRRAAIVALATAASPAVVTLLQSTGIRGPPIAGGSTMLMAEERPAGFYGRV